MEKLIQNKIYELDTAILRCINPKNKNKKAEFITPHPESEIMIVISMPLEKLTLQHGSINEIEGCNAHYISKDTNPIEYLSLLTIYNYGDSHMDLREQLIRELKIPHKMNLLDMWNIYKGVNN